MSSVVKSSVVKKWSTYLFDTRIPVIYLLLIAIGALASGGVLTWAIVTGDRAEPSTVSVEVQHWLPDTEEADRELLNADLPDFSNYSDVAERKEAFFSFVYSFVEFENQRILGHRQELEPIWARVEDDGDLLTQTERQTLDDFARRYRIDAEEMSLREVADELKLRVDIIPPSLVLAQAANESAWGTSRFAREANNLFGQWCFTEGCGLVPHSRPAGALHEVRSFDSVADAVHAYYRNINTNDVYDYLRELRLEMRQEEERLNSLVLAYGLTRYSQRGTEYISELQSMIRFNNLLDLDERVQT